MPRPANARGSFAWWLAMPIACTMGPVDSGATKGSSHTDASADDTRGSSGSSSSLASGAIESDVSESTGAPPSTTEAEGTTSIESTGAWTDASTDDVGVAVRFDVGDFPDLPESPAIPPTCALAEQSETTIGCLFFAVDLDQLGEGDADPEIALYAVVASNVQLDTTAAVTVELKVDGVWNVVEGPIAIPPRGLHVFELPDHHQDMSGRLEGGAYRLTSDIPVAAYQFNPWVAGAATSDASLLYPVASWDTQAHVVQWVNRNYSAYLTIVAASDGTVVTVEPAVETLAGPGVTAGGPTTPILIELDEGDIAEVMAPREANITGTTVASNHPIGVFSGHECANIPEAVGGCDHLEEQLSGLRLWGTQFVASRVTPRNPDVPETSAWHIYASEDGTELVFDAAEGITGLPDAPVVLGRGEALELFVTGPPEHPGDFLVTTSRPAMLINYMTGIPHDGDNMLGDPAMVQISPVEQYLTRYVLLVPSQWEYDDLVVTRPTGAAITLDGTPIADAAFIEVGPGYEVARVRVEDGVHALDGEDAFGVVVVGYDFANSYAYLGGAGTSRINPVPAG